MANIQHELSKAHDWDDDAFSFEATETPQGKAMMGEEGPLTPSDSPADFLFANGHLLPHAFRPPPDSFRKSISKDSLTCSSSKGSSSSSRSNSTGGNSRLDIDSKSSSDDAEKAVPPGKPVIKHVRFRSRDDIAPSLPRWHFMLSPGRESSAELSPRRRMADGKERQDRRGRNPTHTNQSSGNSSAGCGIFRSFVSACRECHALEPSMQAEIRRAPPETIASSRVRSRAYV
ncbi:hypothetical protein ACLOJK_039347 [Asimina triloba]